MVNKETLEEAANKKMMSNDWLNGAKFGAKWQQEQDKNKYSEEEVIRLLIKFNQEIQEVKDVREWFNNLI
jgi:hypothetical protein